MVTLFIPALSKYFFFRCVEHFLDEEPNISFGALYQNALEQWTMNDLSDIGLKCLPTSIATAPITLPANYPLQLQYIQDISTSAYDQLRQLYNQKLDETEAEQSETMNANASK